MGIDVAVTLLLSLLDRATAFGAVITKARAEGRDISQAELDGFAQTDDAARAALVAEIAKARASGA